MQHDQFMLGRIRVQVFEYCAANLRQSPTCIILSDLDWYRLAYEVTADMVFDQQADTNECKVLGLHILVKRGADGIVIGGSKEAAHAIENGAYRPRL